MIKKNQDESFGQYIKRLRYAKGYSQRKLAQVTGISNTTISRIENGETTNPDIPTLKLLSKFLNIDENYMLKSAGYLDEDEQHGDNAIPVPPDYPYKVTSRDKAQYKKHMEQLAETLFMDDETSDEDKEEIINIMNEIFWKAKLMNKRKPKLGK